MILLIGGALSGKSAFATSLGLALDAKIEKPGKVIYVAPVARDHVALDMQQRMDSQKSRRPPGWLFLEPPYQPEVLKQLADENDQGVLIFDGLNLWLGYEISSKSSTYDFKALEMHCRKELAHLLEILANLKVRTIVTSGVVNEGLPPSHESGRLMRDLLSQATQTLASRAELVCRLDSGIATTIKVPEKWTVGMTPMGWSPAWNVEPKALAKALVEGRMPLS